MTDIITIVLILWNDLELDFFKMLYIIRIKNVLSIINKLDE